MRNTLKASLALFLALGAGSAMAQSAPTLSGQTFVQANEIRASRASASNSAIQGEQIRLQRAAIEAQQQQAQALQALSEQAGQPLQFSSGENGEFGFSIPSGAGLFGGSVSYVINVQNGNGNIASNAVVETDVSGSVTEVVSDEQVEK